LIILFALIISASGEPMTETLKFILGKMQAAFLPDQAIGLSLDVQIDIEGELWGLIINSQKCDLVEGEIDNPTYTLQTSFHTMDAIVAGDLKATAAYMRGDVRFTGDIFSAMKLTDIFSLSQDYLD
jgi:putative sterol carrier protein